MTRLAVYARVSSDDQAERGTIENQLEFARKYADLHQLDVIKWYKDDGVTGTIPIEARPAGQELIEDAKNGLIDLLLIYKLDRLGRSARIILNAVHELEGYGVKIRSMTEPFDTGDPSGRFLLTILAGVADLERETIIERMWYGANRAARAGKWLGGIVPYGYYVNEDGFLEINENPLPGHDISEASVIRLIYHMLANQGHSCIKVADYLNALGVPPSYTKDGRTIKKGKRKENTAGIWRPSRIRNMIVNSIYKGIHLYGKRSNKKRELIERVMPAIVDEETWNKAQMTLKNNQIEAMKNSKRSYLLRGLIKCGCCGITYVGIAYPGQARNLKGYYVCGGKQAYKGPLQGKCKSKNVPQEWIEELVWKDCLAFINEPGEALEQLAAGMEQRQSQKSSLHSEKSSIMKAVDDKENERQSIIDLFRKNIINFTDLEKQIQKINQEKVFLEQRITELDQLIKVDVQYETKMINAFELLTKLRSKLTDNPSFEVKREIVKSLVSQIIVHTIDNGDGRRPRATITTKYTFSKDVIHTDKRGDNNLEISVERDTCMSRDIFNEETLGGRIRRARLAKNMTIKELANEVGLSEITVGIIELGKTGTELSNLRRFASVLNLSIPILGGFDKLPADTFGQKIKKARLYYGLTKREFASKIGVNEKTIRLWENEKYVPTHVYMEKLSEYISILNTAE